VTVLISRRALLSAASAAAALAPNVPRCVVLDLGCLLPESLAGFRSQVAVSDSTNPDLVIVPAAGAFMPALLRPFLNRGATVLLELFKSEGRITTQPYFPYVEYSWPIQAKIREFAAVSLDPVPGDHVIGTLAQQPVALRRRVGRGTLVTLASPLGPIFLSGDPDARRWLAAFLGLSIRCGASPLGLRPQLDGLERSLRLSPPHP
jgi:hypothetical protein